MTMRPAVPTGTPVSTARPGAPAWPRSGVWGGVVAGPLFVLVVVGQLLTRHGFDLRRHPLSLLTLGDRGWIQIVNFLLAGVLFLGFAASARPVLRGGRGAIWGPLLLAGHGAGLLLAGLFVPDPALGFPPGAGPAGPSLSAHAVLHGIGFGLAFTSLTAACLVFGSRAHADGRRGWARYDILTGITTALLAASPDVDLRSLSYFAAGLVAWTWTTAFALSLLGRVGGSDAEPNPGR